jgi:hypothetical protein
MTTDFLRLEGDVEDVEVLVKALGSSTFLPTEIQAGK